ncbi:hypothetical protein GGR53DRAFT_520291 [Hypoxylon sp. FL1150]|nr:hypothetical protein GGR53DRAFT_520291 [Hypoxylon sp. FL1150]
MNVTFDISPEKEASKLQFFYRQFFSDADLAGKTAIVTGANGGIGLECARILLNLGLSKLIIAVRDKTKGDVAAKTLRSDPKLASCTIEVWELDLASYESVTNFATRAQGLEHLDIAILNASIYRTTLCLVPSTGHDENVQVNFLSNMLLAVLLLPILKAKRRGFHPGRLVIVSSDTAAWSAFKEKNEDRILPAFGKDAPGVYAHNQQYGSSKLLGQLFLTELAKRVSPSIAIVDCVNPGFCHGSRLARDADGSFLGYIVVVYAHVVGRAAAKGALSVVDAAVRHEQEAHGQYLEHGKLAPMAPIKLWSETMNELSFADVEGIIRDLSN